MEASPNSLNPQFSIQLNDKKGDVDEFYRWLLQQKNEFKEDIIRFLAKQEKKKYKSTSEVASKLSTSGYIKTTKMNEDYMPISEGIQPLMNLQSASEIADILSMELDPVHSTTWTDPMVRTNKIAALFGLAAGQMLDNPRYKFQGNETDAVSFTLMVCKTMQSVSDRSKGGLFMKEIAESTVNYESKTLSSQDMNGQRGMVGMPRRPSTVDKLFAPRR